MSEEILINVTAVETRVALLENGMLQDVYVERSANRGIVGNIYLGKVVRVLPGMQAAFIDIGLEKASFIHASDICKPYDEGGNKVAEANITSLLHDGQQVVVQVQKEPLGSKGARLTMHLSVSSRFLVYAPGATHIGISQRIEDESERDRLRSLVAEQVQLKQYHEDGFIVRTAAEGGEQEILADMDFLKRVWSAVERRKINAQAPKLLYEDLPLHLRTLRDMLRPEIERIRIDTEIGYTALSEFAEEYIPEIKTQIELYHGSRPLFDLYSIEDEIKRALQRKVELKSGGSLVFDQTEAMTTVDVNTGAYVGHRNLEETVFKTNLEATVALARQLRLRNLGGIVIVDFIDMKDAEHRRQVLRALEKALLKDYAKTSFNGFSDLGLVQLTRKRTRESLAHVLCDICPVCDGRGSIRSPETVCYEIFREILRDAKAYENDTLMVLASEKVVERLLDEESSSVADLEEQIGKTIRFSVEPMYNFEQFDVVLL